MEPTEIFLPEALNLLEEAGYEWSKYIIAFKANKSIWAPTKESHCSLKSTISYEEMRDHGLVRSATENEQRLGLQWLHDTLNAVA
jgi:hypothetical protein